MRLFRVVAVLLALSALGCLSNILLPPSPLQVSASTQSIKVSIHAWTSTSTLAAIGLRIRKFLLTSRNG